METISERICKRTDIVASRLSANDDDDDTDYQDIVLTNITPAVQYPNNNHLAKVSSQKSLNKTQIPLLCFVVQTFLVDQSILTLCLGRGSLAMFR